MSMRNPLNRRLPRELKSEIGKYLVILILLIATVSFVSGFLIADGSMKKEYDQSFTKYNIEDGYFDVSQELTKEQIESIEDNEITLYKNYFVEKSFSNDSTLRIFKNRKQVDKVCIMEGQLPTQSGEIAIDRMYADNNHLKVGDTIKSGDKKWIITGLVALSDYSALFSNNNDTMFDAVKFGVAIISDYDFSSLQNQNITYRYSWVYDTKPANDTMENDISEKLMTSISKIITLDKYVPQYQNQSITFTGNDMGSDRAMMIVLLYIIMVILAFVFGITISSTITKEANTIGTLRASGYTRGEMIRHYLALPLLVTLIGAILGNILGYTLLEDVCAQLYYGSYSLTKYVSSFNGEAFILTTIVPFIIMLVINFTILIYKLSLTPLHFLRRDLRRRKQRKAIHLNHHIPFFSRFRLRILLQNRSNYFMLFIGILFANLLLLFGMGLPVVLDHYQENVQNNMLSPYQTMLNPPVSLIGNDDPIEQMMMSMQYLENIETDNSSSEKFSAYSLNTTSDICDSEEILIYGINNHSKYIKIDFSKLKKNHVYVSSAYADKYLLKKGDTITLKEKYQDKTYNFKVAGIYDYIGSLTIFMSQEQLNQKLELGDNYFNGYFSKTEIQDIDSKYIGTVIDLNELTKVTRQLDVSMGSMMYMVDAFAILIFIVLIYLLSKLVIEKNTQSISMTKIMGYSDQEISKLYILATSLTVILSFVLTAFIDYFIIVWIFRQMMLASMSGWITFEVDQWLFIKMFIIGIITYALVAIFEINKIKNIPLDEALKNIE